MSRERSGSPAKTFWQNEEKKAQAQGLLTKPLSPRASPTSPGTYRKIRMTPPSAAKPSSPVFKPYSDTAGKTPPSTSAKSPSRRSRSPARVVEGRRQHSQRPVEIMDPTTKSEQLEINMVAKEEEELPLPPPPLQVSFPAESGSMIEEPAVRKSEEQAEDLLNAPESEKNVQELVNEEGVEVAKAPMDEPVQETTNEVVPTASVSEATLTTLMEAVQNCDLSGEPTEEDTPVKAEADEAKDSKQEGEKTHLDETVGIVGPQDLDATMQVADQ